MNASHTASRWVVCLLLLAFSTLAKGQDNLNVSRIFDTYGKSKGATMVVLSGKTDELKPYKLDLFKSITLTLTDDIADDIQQCLKADKHRAKKIKEVVNDGIIWSGYYQLPEHQRNINRYILFKQNTNRQATLIYMEGKMESEQLVEKLFIKRN